MARSSNIDIMLRLRGQRQFNREVKKSAAQLEAMGVRGASALGAFATKSAQLKDFGRNLTTKVTLPIVAMGALSVKAAADWQSAFAGVRKTVDATGPQLARIGAGIRQMSLEIPTSANDLADIAASAGALGIQQQNILGFTRVVADLGETTNLVGEEGATALARFANITRMSQGQFDRLGSTIVALGNKGASTESEIAAMGLRLAAAGSYVGMSQPQILGFANALSSLGIEAEAGGTAMSQVFKTINSAVAAGGDDLQKFAEVAGMSGEQFRKAWTENAAMATVEWIQGLDRMKKAGEDVPAFLDQLSSRLRGSRIQDTLLRAAGGTGLAKSLRDGTEAWRENTAMAEEAQKRYQTFNAKLQILKNQVIDLGVTLGTTLLPPLTRFVTWIGPKISGVAKWFSKLPKPIQNAAIAMAVLAAAAGPLIWLTGSLAGGIGNILILGGKLASMGGIAGLFGAGGSLAFLANPITAIVAGVIALGVAFFIAYKKIKPFREWVDKTVDSLENDLGPTLKDFTAGLEDLGESLQILGTSAKPLLGPLAQILKFVLGQVLVFYLGVASRWLRGFSQTLRGFGQVFRGVMMLVKAILKGDWKGAWTAAKLIMRGALNVILGSLRTATATFRQIVVSMLSPFRTVWAGIRSGFNTVIGFIGTIPGRISAASTGMWDGIKEAFRSAINWIINAWNGLEFSVPGAKVFGKEIGGFTIGTPDIPQLAAGGTVTQGGWSTVGEKGPELRYLPKAASVVPLKNDVVREAVGDRGPSIAYLMLDGEKIAEATFGEASDAAALV